MNAIPKRAADFSPRGQLSAARYPCARWIVFFALSCSALAQTPDDATPHAVPNDNESELAYSVSAIEAHLARVDSIPDVDDATRDKLRELYTQALEQAKAVAEWESKLVEYQRARLSAVERLEAVKSQLSQAPSEAEAALPAGAPVSELEQALSQKSAEWAAAQKATKDLQDGASFRSSRRKEIPARIVEIRQQLDELIPSLEVAGDKEGKVLVSVAERTLGNAKRRALEAEWACIEEELAAYDAREPEWTAKADLAARDSARLENLVKAWREQVSLRRTQEAEQAANEAVLAQRDATRKHPVAKEIADGNARLAAERSELTSQLAAAEARLEEVQSSYKRQLEGFEKIKEIVSKVGLTQALALTVRHELGALPDGASLRQNIRRRQITYSDAFLRDERNNAERKHLLAAFDKELKSKLALVEADPSLHESQRTEIETTVGELLQARLTLLNDLEKVYKDYKKRLIELDGAETDLISHTRSYSRYLSERVLWIRNSEPMNLTVLSAAWEGWKDFIASPGWGEALALWSGDFRRNPIALGLAVLALLILAALQPALLSALRKCGDDAARATLKASAPTFRALMVTVLLASVWPATTWFFAWRLSLPLERSEFVNGIGDGLEVISAGLFFLWFLNHLCRPGGLGDAHFGWSPRALQVVRRNLMWFGVLIIPLGFASTLLESLSGEDPHRDAFARIVFLCWGGCSLLFIHNVLRLNRGAFHDAMVANLEGWLHQFRFVWFTLAIVLPLALLVASLMGFHYTALQLAWRLRLTLYLIVGLIVLQALLERWLLAAKRKLAIEQFRKARAAQAEKREAEAEGTMASGEATVEHEPLDLPKISAQTRRLLNAAVMALFFIGMWGTWVDVLPALNRLRDVHLWALTVKAADAGSKSEGAALVETQQFVTLADLVKSVFILMVTFVAGRNLPGLLEISVLGWFRLDAGGRYAFTTMSRYLITVVGLVMSCAAIGITWSTVQWLAAAITVGLGFGLQEIFANVVAGLILLFERPIRLGDTVTVSGATGKVTRIRIRATTILDWDRKEMIIPNREFVTGSVVNWSLTDRLLRLILRVGVAYGSDTELVSKLLVQAARSNKRVEEEPTPRVVLAGFGENSLDFELQIFITNADEINPVRHELNMAIERSLRDAGVQIPFPQRDMHIKSVTVVPELGMTRT